ncbi:hypothetical protein D3C75_1089930 [compost metagenome]
MGSSLTHKELSCELAQINKANEITMNRITSAELIKPAGMARFLVLGFLASMALSITRLRLMAAVRAPTMASVTQPIWLQEGKCPFTVMEPKRAPI